MEGNKRESKQLNGHNELENEEVVKERGLRRRLSSNPPLQFSFTYPKSRFLTAVWILRFGQLTEVLCVCVLVGSSFSSSTHQFPIQNPSQLISDLPSFLYFSLFLSHTHVYTHMDMQTQAHTEEQPNDQKKVLILYNKCVIIIFLLKFKSMNLTKG